MEEKELEKTQLTQEELKILYKGLLADKRKKLAVPRIIAKYGFSREAREARKIRCVSIYNESLVSLVSIITDRK
ncbi:MAG: hypothetical protein ACE5J2_07410 [Nitrososphaerales archaeon]